jgi:mannose-1-phosphate guanylyltransferase/mannose-1-phosphate guanylyltransferase/phosphomannomutase
MVLAAGLGTRLRPITYAIPKPMVPVVNRPVMEHSLRLLARHGFREAIANLHWFPETIEDRFGDGSDFGLELTYSREERLLGTAGGVRNAADFLGDSFLVVAGDALTDLDFTAMREFHESHDGLATVATKRVADTDQYGVVITGDDGRIQGFQEKPDPAEALSDLANCGIYMFGSEIFDYFPGEGHRSPAGDDDQPPGFVDWALDVFPALLEGDVPFRAHEIDAYWNDIGSVEEYVQGNFDALRGDLRIAGHHQVADGIYADAGSDLDGVKVRAPVLVGAGCEIGIGAELHGPVVVGDGARIGAAARVRDAVVLPGAELGPGAVAVGGVFGTDQDRPLG